MTRPNTFLFDLAPTAFGRIQLCRTGSFYRHDQGSFKVSKAMLETMAANAVERGVEIPIKLNHEGRTFAVGWVSPSSLKVQPWGSFHGLFGVAKWSDGDVQAAGKQGKLRYTSPEIVWNDRRMADSPRGKAGEPIGPTLCGIALVLDPFFTMDPVVFSRLSSVPLFPLKPTRRSYSMLTSEQIRAALTKADVPEANLDKATLVILDLCMAEANPAAAAPEEPMAAANPEEPKPEDQMGSYSKDPVFVALQKQNEVMAKKLEVVEKKQAEQAKKDREALYAEFDRKGKLKNADPKEAKELLEKYGEFAFRAAYGRNPELTEQAAPAGPANNRSAANSGIPSNGQETMPGTAHPILFNRQGFAPSVDDGAVREYMKQNPGTSYGQATRAISKELKRKTA